MLGGCEVVDKFDNPDLAPNPCKWIISTSDPNHWSDHFQRDITVGLAAIQLLGPLVFGWYIFGLDTDVPRFFPKEKFQWKNLVL